jgi:hypothetical protein
VGAIYDGDVVLGEICDSGHLSKEGQLPNKFGVGFFAFLGQRCSPETPLAKAGRLGLPASRWQCAC